LGRGRWNYLFLDLGQTKAYKVKPGDLAINRRGSFNTNPS
jgi:hypothetical protein